MSRIDSRGRADDEMPSNDLRTRYPPSRSSRLEARQADETLRSDDTSSANAKVNVESTTSSRNAARSQFSPGWRYLLYALPFLVTYTHVILSPHTKVEETPALHAVYDLLYFGIGPKTIQSYDHVQYPGPVPRSFIPSLIIAAVVYPLSLAGQAIGLVESKLDVLILTRLVIATFFSFSFAHLTRSIELAFSPSTSIWFVLLSLSQFHVPYYAGRTLPNFLALPPVLYSVSLLLRGLRNHDKRSLNRSIALLTLAATVVRLEIAPMPVVLSMALVILQRLTFLQALQAGATGGFAGLALSSTIDLYFLHPTSHSFKYWPELSAFSFNIVHQKASDWGVSPWHYYFTRALPKLCMLALPLAAIGTAAAVLRSRQDRFRIQALGVLLVMGLAQIVAMSFVGHKEWRFVVYAVPLLNICAAVAATSLWTARHPLLQRLYRLSLVGALIAQLGVSVFSTYVSVLNYPGGQVGDVLKGLPDGSKIWIPAAALHTGSTRFTLPTTFHFASPTLSDPSAPSNSVSAIPRETPRNITLIHPESAYERCTYPFGNTPQELWDEGYHYAITDDVGGFTELEKRYRWAVEAEIEGYEGIRVGKRWPFVEVKVGRKLGVMRRIGDGEMV